MIIVNGWKPLIITTKRSILDAAAVLGLPLKFYDSRVSLETSPIIEMGKVLPNILYLSLALKWVSKNFCVILYLLFNGFYFGHFQKEK